MGLLVKPATLAAMLLAGCSALVPSGVTRLGALSPLDVDPSAVTLALVLPEGIDVVPGSATLRLGAVRADTGEATEAAIVLEATSGDPAAFGAVGGLRYFRVGAADTARMRAMQDEVRTWKETDGATTRGTLSVALAGCTLGPGPAPDARASAYLRTEPGAEFFPILREARIADLGDTQQPSPCPGGNGAEPEGAH